MNYSKGFTLIEILIALTIFAIIAAITSSSLYYAFNSRLRVNAQAEVLNNLQLTYSLIQQDITQTVDRATRGNEMHLFSAFIGQAQYLEFTRGGSINPKSIAKQSTLKRIALVCDHAALFRRTWANLDSVNRAVYEDKLLIDNLSDCHFKYLNQNNQLLNEWNVSSATQEQAGARLPKAVQINLTLKEWGEMNLWFIIPEGLYATI